jgi:anti-sigma factor RsiW
MALAPDHPELNDQLNAYLDGELDAEAARALEARLNLDPKAREEAETLKRTWELLDYLPRPEPSPSFTHRTMERLAPVQTASARLPVSRGWRAWAPAAGWAAAVLLAGLGGYAAVTWFQTGPRPDPERELVRDLGVIENKRLYDQVDDLEFLQALDHPDLFGDEHSDS